ncbi:AAA family ATPase [Gaopeijia maritima]|uniref:AAA family ATPase n=1 Tax=Gaopeijia maritima TaxID=3119007 RepID=UPI003294D670
MNDAVHDLELLFRSRHAVVHLDTAEEGRARGILHHVAHRLEIPFFVWTRSRGLQRAGMTGGVYGTAEPAAALEHVAHARIDALYHFRGLSREALEGDLPTALVRDCAESLAGRTGALVLTGPRLDLPEALGAVVTHASLPCPSPDELRELLGQVVRDVSERRHVQVDIAPADLETLLTHLGGLTLIEAEKVLTRALVEDGVLNADDLRLVGDAKKSLIERDGLLEYTPVEASLADIADLAGFKAWLAHRTAVVRDPARARAAGLPFPRGVLLLGVPGCGKSLAAKAVAAEWRLPLLRLDPSGLYNKYIGESERNFRRAMDTAERMAPVILWIDELEKAFASGGSEDGGVSQRVLGTFLSWLQERRGDVFVVATANDVQKLPPEFLRKGRFDEVFFVDLPDLETRAEILRIHLQSRDQDPGGFPLRELAEAAEGFSGSELEQAVVSVQYAAFAHGGTVEPDALRAEISRTRPLSVTMAEPIARLRSWAADRTVSAN